MPERIYVKIEDPNLKKILKPLTPKMRTRILEGLLNGAVKRGHMDLVVMISHRKGAGNGNGNGNGHGRKRPTTTKDRDISEVAADVEQKPGRQGIVEDILGRIPS